MSYEYTDPTGFVLSVWGNEDYTYVASKRSEREEPFGVYLPHADAPAVALAILEAAGIDVAMNADFVVDPDECAGKAMWWLRRHTGKQAEREAEDAKVRKFRAALGFPNEPDRMVREHHRKQYHRAREFFAKEDTPAPRVLQYGDPEPEAGTWRSNNGILYEKNAIGWFTFSGCYSVLWSNFSAGAFPMTEVTGDVSR